MSFPLKYVLFPGRHHMVTRFQGAYLRSLLSNGEVDDSGQRVLLAPDAEVVWAITSATHSGTRRNPVPSNRREALIERVALSVGLPSVVAPVADVPTSDRFAHTVLTSVESTTGRTLTPDNTVVACSTPAVAGQYAALGFRIVTVEASVDPQPERPWDVLELMVANDPSWRNLAHPQAVAFYDRYALDAQVRLVHTDPTVGAEGDLTETRDYRTYIAAFDDGSDRKYDQVAPFVVPGKIVDMGCAAGGLIERLARDPRLAESDLYGVDISRHLIAEAEHRKAQGLFANPNVFFAQRNLLRSSVFPDASVNTTITVALTHEISSYGAGRADLELLAKRIFEHTAPGGVWINSDVLGPDNPDEMVSLWFGPEQRRHLARAVDMTGWPREQVRAHLESLSTQERLVQFQHDFATLAGKQITVHWQDSNRLASMHRGAAMEFLYTRDYLDNWLSECHERFCDMTYADWAELVTSVGFEVAQGSGPWRNDWLIKNRLSKGVALDHGDPARWPNTHLLMVARKPL